MEDNKKKVVKEFIRKIKGEYGDKIEKIILFGSYVRGDYTRDSDIDVLIVTKIKDLSLERDIIDTSFDILLEFSVDISPKVYSKEEFETEKKLRAPFMLEIEKEGVALA